MLGRPPAPWIRNHLSQYVDEVLSTKEIMAITGQSKQNVAHSMKKYFGKPGHYGPRLRFQSRWLITAEGLQKAGAKGIISWEC